MTGPYAVDCVRCSGEGYDADGDFCSRCAGTGYIEAHNGKAVTRPDAGGRTRYGWVCSCGWQADGLSTAGMAYAVGGQHEGTS